MIRSIALSNASVHRRSKIEDHLPLDIKIRANRTGNRVNDRWLMKKHFQPSLLCQGEPSFGFPQRRRAFQSGKRLIDMRIVGEQSFADRLFRRAYAQHGAGFIKPSIDPAVAFRKFIVGKLDNDAIPLSGQGHESNGLKLRPINAHARFWQDSKQGAMTRPGVASILPGSIGTGGGSTAQERAQIDFSEKAIIE